MLIDLSSMFQVYQSTLSFDKRLQFLDFFQGELMIPNTK